MKTTATTALVVVVVLFALTGFDLFRLFQEGRDAPSDDDYDFAAALDADGFDGTRDVIAALPAWSLRPSMVLKPRPFISGDALHTQPLHRHRRLYVVREPDSDDAFDALTARGFKSTRIGQSGPVSLHRFDVDAGTVTLDFRNDLERAAVRIADGRGDELAGCRDRTRGGFRCTGKKNWQRVTREHLLVSENGDDAIWVHPPSPNERLEIVFNDATLEDAIVVRAGHTRTGSDKATAPVKVELILGDQRLWSEDIAPAFDFRTFTIDTASRKGERGPLMIRVSTTNNGTQHFAVDGYVVDLSNRARGTADKNRATPTTTVAPGEAPR